MDTNELIERIQEELMTAQNAISQYKQVQNITALRKAYDSINIARNFIGSEIKQVTTSYEKE